MSVTTLETCLLYGMFGSGLIPMGYASYVSLFLTNISDIGTAIKAGIQAGEIRDLVFCSLPDKQHVHVIYGGMIYD